MSKSRIKLINWAKFAGDWFQPRGSCGSWIKAWENERANVCLLAD